MIDAFYKKIFTRAKDPSESQAKFVYDLSSSERITIFPGERKNVRTSLAISIPNGYFGMIISKKELYIKSGVIAYPEIFTDNSFQEIRVYLSNINSPKDILSKSDYERMFGEKNKFDIFIGDKIAQIILLPINQVNWIEKYD